MPCTYRADLDTCLAHTHTHNSNTPLLPLKMHSCTDVKLLSPSLCDWVASTGIPGIYLAQSEELPSIYVRLVKHYIYYRVAIMISQFTEGLNSCGGLWEMAQSNWEDFVPVMTSGPVSAAKQSRAWSPWLYMLPPRRRRLHRCGDKFMKWMDFWGPAETDFMELKDVCKIWT